VQYPSSVSRSPTLPASHVRETTQSVWLPALLLVGSGFSALVYQVLWLRLLGLVFGVTIHAASTVLAAFMAGLALGSLASGRVADRVRAPLRWFGAAELLIGLTALATPVALSALNGLYQHLHASVSQDLRVLTLARFLCSFMVLLVPTTLMGATMPLVIRAAARRVQDLGGHAAILYASNTAGALLGALITGYYLVGTVGISTSFQIAAVINLLVGAGALLWHRVSAAPAPVSPVADARTAGITLPASARTLLLVVFTLSGFVTLALEIVWFRTLVMFLPATTYVFTTILAVVLGGIALGSALATRALRRERDWLARLSVLQIAIAVAAVASLAAQAWTYSRGWRTGAALQASALSVLPTMVLMGAAFPIGLFCWTAASNDADRRAGERVGRFYLFNLCGAIAGAVAAGFVLIPTLGTRGSLLLVSSLSLASGLALLLQVAPRRRGFALRTAAGGLLLFALAAVVMPDPIESVLTRRYGGAPLLWREEGAQSTVSIHQGEHRVMYLDGLHQANDSPEMLATHRLIGTVAMALHPDARSALVIGLGGGATAGAVAQFSDASIDIVELSPTVVRGAEWFSHVNGDVLRRPNVRVHVDDGRNYLLLTPKRYDVITADIIQPFHAGAGSLYSREYYQLAARVLREDGVMLQWIGHRPDAQYRLIARTFLDTFPHTTVWAGGTLLAGRTRPLRISEERYRQRFVADEDFRNAMRLVGITDLSQLLALYTAGPEELRPFIGEGPVLTDDHPMVEFFLSLPRGDEQIALEGLRGGVNRHVVR